METAVAFRPFKIPRPVETQFFQVSDVANQSFMEADLARSGLTPEDVMAYTTPLIKKEGATAAYSIPYFGLDGKPLVDKQGYPVMFRTRFRLPEFSKEQRYTQPSGETLVKHELPSILPYIHPATLSTSSDYIVCCEGEKKTGAVIKALGIQAFGIGGCQMWRDPSGSGSVHPWIRELVKGKSKIVIIPDGDVLRYDICNAYGTFAAALRAEGIDVELLNPGGKIDDLLVLWKEDAKSNFANLPSLSPEELVQSPVSLAKRYNLAFKQNDKGVITVHQHTSNVMKLMEEHNAFPQIWRNTDNNRVMVGENTAQPDLTEMDIANYFQHNLGFDKVNHRIVYSCIQALAKRNSRSPMLDYIQAQSWDGNTRLKTWLHRLWGVERSPYTDEIAEKWLVSACARMEKPGTKLDWMLIVVGPQGTGKTSMPSILFKDNSITLYGDHNDKDLHMLLHSALCVGFDELDSFGKRESSNLKAMITRNEDAFRPPYGASVEIFPRRFTLYGCGNRYEFLQHDPSGYRRYAVIEATRLLDFAGLESERDQLWAEAWHRYQEGTKFWEIEGASAQAEKYVVVNPMEDKVDEFIARKLTDKISPGKATSGFVYFTMSELLIHLEMEKEARNSTMIRELSAILRSKGAKKPEKATRHPDTGAVGKWYIIEPTAPAHI